MTALKTARLELQSVSVRDTDRITALLHLPDVRRYLCDDQLMPRTDVAAAIAESLDNSALTTYWHIALASNSQGLIGLIGLRPQMATALRLRNIGWRSLELLIALDPTHWGKGLAAEAIEAVAEYTATHGVTFALIAGVDEPNTRSHRLMRRCGFHELGVVPGPLYPVVPQAVV